MKNKAGGLIVVLIIAGIAKFVHKAATHTDDLVELVPHAAAKPAALARKDAEMYVRLHEAAQNGDAEAMLKMSELTRSGRVTDPSEPSHAYWLFQAAKAGNASAAESAQQECSLRTDLRQTDKLFDQECSSGFGLPNAKP